jgi:mannose/fructose/N-acetylgalactosamine-specific phosphotransferase system component IID
MTIDANFFFSLTGLVISVGTVLVGAGILIAQIKNLEKRTDEDRARNSEQHKEFYASRATQGERIGGIEAMLHAMERDVAEIKDDVKNGFKEIREELKKTGRLT